MASQHATDERWDSFNNKWVPITVRHEPRCKIKDCPFSGALVFVEGYCEGHYEQQFITPILKEEANARDLLHNLQNTRYAHQQKLRFAREIAGIKPPMMTCHVCTEFKTASAIALKSHETFCKGPKIKPASQRAKVKATAANKPKLATGRAESKPELTEDDL